MPDVAGAEPPMESSLPAGWQLRAATAADAPLVHQLFAQHRAELGWEPDPTLDADVIGFPATYARPGDALLLAWDDAGRPAGMGGILGGEVRRLHVVPASRRHGLARMLVLRLLETARSHGHRHFHTVVAARNPASRRLFESCGFLPTGQPPQHPKALACEPMELRLPPSPERPVAVVTGGSRGLGRHLVLHLAGRYHVVFGWRRSTEAAQAVAREADALGGWACPVRSDAANWAHTRFLAQFVATLVGPCQTMIHTTGTFSMKPLAQLDPATWREELDSTATAGFHAGRAFEPQLRSHPRARLVFVGDVAADRLQAQRCSTAYYVGKHGLLLLARTFAEEHAGTGLTCNLLSPGILPNSADLDPPHRVPNVAFEEIAALVDFLLSPAADALSGSHLIASRGWNV